MQHEKQDKLRKLVMHLLDMILRKKAIHILNESELFEIIRKIILFKINSKIV
jgi:hypothetical protein